MQAPRSLSISQKDSLETVHVCLQGICSFLQGINGPINADDKVVAEQLCLLAELCDYKIVNEFQLRVWPRESRNVKPPNGK
jgi:hypothetical protein